MPTYAPASGTGRIGSIQSYTVPTTARYKIECWGAKGGDGVGGGGGSGAYRYGEMSLTAGEVLSIIPGQMGTRAAGPSGFEGGGGGGSFVYRGANELLCAAGGGGGGSNFSAGQSAVTTEAATSGFGGSAGGTGGNGGSGNHGAAGGGWHSTGGTASWSHAGPVRPGSACKPGATYDSQSGGQAYGGFGDSTYLPNGGYGGGAGAHGNSYVAGGGGGGYSGGGGAAQGQGGGGGGSFVHASMTATGGTAGARSSFGLVVVTQINRLPDAPADLVVPTPVYTPDPITASWRHVDLDADVQNQHQLRYRTAD